MPSLFISRIISMRDANGSRRKPVVSSKTYAMASPPELYDDSDSDDADDEYETGDEYLIISSSDAVSEQGQAEDCESDWGDIAVEDDFSSLDIIDDYFNNPNLVPYQEFHYDLLSSSDESGENDPPVIKLNLTNPPDVVNSTTTNPLGNSYVTLQEGTSALNRQDENHDGDAKSCPLGMASFSDNWACELEAAQEENIVKDEKTITVSKIRHPSQTNTLSTRSARSGRPRDRKVAFTIRPNVFDEPSS
ncbi:hypothetical protein PG990_006116 [Apiospora arundinis]|uniref:Uncharacterized protein n=1 Tax=Apiospora arundinis TaxID=335852 RepID=A0ABR2JAE7_9PEZI